MYKDKVKDKNPPSPPQSKKKDKTCEEKRKNKLGLQDRTNM
jgi:hypothetical protein